MYDDTQKVGAPLGDKPLVTIVAGHADPPPPGVTKAQWDALVSEKVEEKRGYAQLSRNSKVVFDANSGHSVHLEDPEIVVNAIHDVQAAIAKHSSLEDAKKR